MSSSIGMRLVVADNSGLRLVKCIQKALKVGDIVRVVTVRSNKQMAKMHKAVLISTKKPFRRPDGTHVRFDTNACVILDDKGSPIANRVTAPIPYELRAKQMAKLFSLSKFKPI